MQKIKNYKKTDRQLWKSNDQIFGACPRCYDCCIVVNTGRRQFGTCPDCKVVWYAGSDLTGDWRKENWEIWQKNHKMIKEYEIVEPYWPTQSWEEYYITYFRRVRHAIEIIIREVGNLVRVVFGMRPNQPVDFDAPH